MTLPKNEMQNSTNFFLDKWFWTIFTIIAMVVLYLYGKKMIGDKTELAQLKLVLANKEQELTNCNNDNIEKKKKIAEQENMILQKETTIQTLQHNIRLCYGKGMGKIVIYSTCSSGGNTKVWIDEKYAGLLNTYYLSVVGCEASSGVSKFVPAGSHHIYTTDEDGNYTDFYITVNEYECTPQAISCN